MGKEEKSSNESNGLAHKANDLTLLNMREVIAQATTKIHGCPVTTSFVAENYFSSEISV